MEKLDADGDFAAFRIINANGEDPPWQDFTGTATITVKNAAGVVVFGESYKNGERGGPKNTYFDDGKLQEEHNYNRRFCRDRMPYLYADGNIRERGTFDDNGLEGKLEIFRRDSTPKQTEHYHLGSQHGGAIYYLKGNSRKELVSGTAALSDL